MLIMLLGTPDELTKLVMDAVKPQFDAIQAKLDIIIDSENHMKINVQGLIDAVNQETTTDQSILTLLDQVVTQNKSLAQQLADAIAAGDPAAVQAVQDALDASVATMTANAANIVTAVKNNTPAGVPSGPPPPPPPPPAVG